MRNMEEIDKLIKETLTEEETKFYEDLNEEGLFDMVTGIFTGKLRWIIALMSFINLVAFGFCIYFVVQFFEATETVEMIKWAFASFICIMLISMLKVFSWMQMNKNALLREIKRLELLISTLTVK